MNVHWLAPPTNEIRELTLDRKGCVITYNTHIYVILSRRIMKCPVNRHEGKWIVREPVDHTEYPTHSIVGEMDSKVCKQLYQ